MLCLYLVNLVNIQLKSIAMKVSPFIGLFFLILIFSGGPAWCNLYAGHTTTGSEGIQRNNFIANASAAPSVICQGLMTLLSVTTQGGTPPFVYAWTPVSSIINPTLPNTFANPIETTLYRITVTDNNNNMATDSVLITVNQAPSSPGPIAGNMRVCEGDTRNYSIVEVAGGMYYSWSVSPPADSIIGNGTCNVDIIWGNKSGVVQVLAGNDCGNNPIPSLLSVVVKPTPTSLSPINGPGLICNGNNATFYTSSAVSPVSFQWSVPPDAIIQSGQGTDTIYVTWGTSSGNVTAYAVNDCGESPAVVKWVEARAIPLPAGEITGKDTVCQGTESLVYSISPINGATHYVWTTPAGVEIIAGMGTNEVTLQFGASAYTGNLTVKGGNDCGYSIQSVKSIKIKNCTGIDHKGLESTVKIYPNPADNELTIRIIGTERQLHLMVVNSNGEVIYSDNLFDIGINFIKKVDLSRFSKGVYLFRLSKNDRGYTEKVIVK